MACKLRSFRCCKGLETSFLGRSVGNVRAVFVAVVLNGLDTKPLLVFESFASAPQGTFLKGFGWWLLDRHPFRR